MLAKAASLLMEVGAEYSKATLHGAKYLKELLGNLDYVPESVLSLLQMTRSNVECFQKTQKSLMGALRSDPQIRERVELLMSIPGIGEVTALTWVLEIGEVNRFNRFGQAYALHKKNRQGKITEG